MKLSIKYPAAALRRSVATSLVADGFGLGDSAGENVIAEDVDVPIIAGQRVAITGPSGSGKSSLLRAIAGRLAHEGAKVLYPDRLKLNDRPVIDAIPLPFLDAIRLLSACGLSEPRLLLQTASELSEGERWRFRLALALAREPDWIVLDEFAAALDVTLARVLAFNLKRQSLRQGCGVVVATCHEGPIGDLDPDVRIVCDHDGSIEIFRRNMGSDACAHYSRNSTSPSAPVRIGRISLDGITGRPRSDQCGS